MRKRTSKRRWKKRCAAGRIIPACAIVDHGLDRWFVFEPASLAMDLWRVKANG